MRYRRRFRRPNLTEEQQALEKYANRAAVRMVVLTQGLAKQFEYIDSSKDLELVRMVIDNDVEPAIKLAERTQADFEASFKRSKTSPGRTVKPKRAAKKSTEANK